MADIKGALFSDKGMRIVNILFFSSAFLRNCGVIFVACLAWIAYLAFGIKNTPSNPVKIMYAIFMVYASAMIAVNLYAMLSFI